MSVTVSYASMLTVTEVLANNVSALSDKTVRHSLYNSSATANAASSPPATVCASFEQAMTDGAASIDLTALSGVNGASVSGDGLRVQFAKFRNKSTNANVITIAHGVSNGYDGLGDAFSITLPPGGEILVRTLDGGNNIASVNKILDISGTGSQVLECQIVMG